MVMGPDDSATAGVSTDAIKANAAQLAAACSAFRAQKEARAANLNPQRPGEAELSRLDSSIKKNGAFIKKLKQLGEDNRQQLLAEAAKLNLSKYVSEAVSALADAPFKTADIPAAVGMAAALHARYPDFAASLAPALAKAAAGTSKAAGDDDRLAARRQRAALRLLPELLAAGIVTDPAPMMAAIKHLVSSLDFNKDRESALQSATLLGGFVKTAASLLLGGTPEGAAAAAAALPLPEEVLDAQDFSGLPADVAAAAKDLQQQQKELEEEANQRYQLPREQRQLLIKMLDRAFDACSAALSEAHKALILMDRDNERAFATKGDLPEGAAAEYESSRKAYEALHRATAAMADALGKNLPPLAEDAFTRLGADESSSAGGMTAGAAGGSEAIEHVFEDPEVRAFYEQLPDLWSLIPTVLLKDATQPRSSDNSTAIAVGRSEAFDTSAAADSAANSSTATPANGNEPTTAATVAGVSDSHEGTAAASESTEANCSYPAAAAAVAADDDTAAVTGDQHSAIDAILSRLPSCVSRDLCDELAVNFCYSNSKAARRRLMRALMDVPRGNLQLLPYYSRVAATISQAYPEVGAGVLSAVEAEFDALAAKKDLTRAGEEPRLRVAR
eukprot:GHRR01032845.1.p1 GENE.GHRR01032845.1~~GHRR01032845.1.p1  ORF type:complete len:618 (+),score=302.18 GHRR01032845.1:303-2156(+)